MLVYPYYVMNYTENRPVYFKTLDEARDYQRKMNCISSLRYIVFNTKTKKPL